MFLFKYIKNPKYVGAVAPSSKFLANKMLDTIDFKKAKCIIEYGPGTGVFTEKILSRIREDAIVVLIEIHKEFYDILVDLYGHKDNVIIVNDSAEYIDEILNENSIYKVDYIVSGLPFSSLPKEISNTILSKTKMLLNANTEFITFQYTLFKLGLFSEYFDNISYERVIRNLPPAYVLRCRG